MCLTGKPKSKFKTQKAHQLNRIILEFRGSWGNNWLVILQKYNNLYQKPNRYNGLILSLLKFYDYNLSLIII